MSIFANQNKKIMKKLTILMVFCLLFAVVGEAFAGRTKHTKRRSKARTHLVSKGRKNHKKAKRVIGYVPREVADTSSVLCEDTCSHVHGIDMSHYQGDVFWETVSNNTPMAYVYLKATEGGDRIDEKFERNIVMAHVHGLKVGSYHFYRPKTDQRLQLKNFISQCIPEEQDLIPMIDIETTNGLPTEDFCDSLRTFLELVEEAYQQKPLLYTFRNFYNRHLQGKIDGYKLMIAMYTPEEPVLADDRDITMWQYTGKGRIMGVNGYVDKSRFMGDHTLRELRFKH
jgi:lysozyme